MSKAEDFEAVVDALKTYRSRPGMNVGPLEYVASCSPVGRKVALSILARRANEVAVAAGYKSGSYRKGGYSASGRGAFGRLGGGRPGKRNKPTLIVED